MKKIDFQEIMKTLGERLKIIQKKSGKTLPEFAQSLGISRDSLINYQQNRTFPDSRILSTICEKYGINPTWLLMGEGEPFLGEMGTPQVISIDSAMQVIMEIEAEEKIKLTEAQRRALYPILKVLLEDDAEAVRNLIRSYGLTPSEQELKDLGVEEDPALDEGGKKNKGA